MPDQNLYPQFELSGLYRDLAMARTDEDRAAIRAAILDMCRRFSEMKISAR